MSFKRSAKGLFLIFCFAWAFPSCKQEVVRLNASVKNASLQQILVDYKVSNLNDEFRQEKTIVLDTQEECFLDTFDTIFYNFYSCEGPYQLEYIEVKDTQGQVRYSQNPVEPALWDCRRSKKETHIECLCVFTVTDDLLNTPDELTDADILDMSDEF